jgi:hypothetical protein
MLSTLSISMWSARKHDPEASSEIATIHNADEDAGRYNKSLLRRKAMEEIQKIVSEARKEHAYITLPWDDKGYRVLPAAAYMDHAGKMRNMSNRFDAAVGFFEGRYEQLVADAKSWLGSLFRVEDYPGIVQEGQRLRLLCPADLRSKFSFETTVMPLPDAEDFRVSLGEHEKERVKRQITATVEASLRVAARDLWQRLYEAVSHMSERLKAYKETEKKVEHPFRDTVVTNLVKLVDVLPKLNVTGDMELDRLSEQVRASLLVDPQKLRDFESIRNETANAAEAIAQQMKGYMAGYSVPSRSAI